MKILRHYLTVVTFLMLFECKAEAQQKMFGVRIGMNLANESSDSLPSGFSNAVHSGFLAGVQVDRWFGDMWALSVQILYDQKGVSHSINESGPVLGGTFTETGTNDVILNYIEYPVLIKASFGTGDIKPYVFAGPSLGIFLSGSQKINATGTIFGVTARVDTTISIADSSIKTFEVSAIFGAGVSFKLGFGQVLFIDAAYALGLTKVFVNSTGTVESRDIRLAVGILFPFGRQH